MDTPYLFTSNRLGFRNWIESDLPLMATINANKDVMEFFPALQDYSHTKTFIESMQQQYTDKGYCYFATDSLDTGTFIGFIGLSYKTFQASFTPCVDIGWRLTKAAWGKGFATEAAIRCLEYGFNKLGLEKIYATAPLVNLPSIAVMKKAGMTQIGTFIHPLLPNDERLKECVLYLKTPNN